MYKQKAGLLLCALLFLFGNVVVFLPRKVSAKDFSDDNAVTDFCNPTTTAFGNSKDNRAAGSWAKLSFVNRSVIKVNIDGACKNDILVGNTLLSPKINGNYVDVNIDGNFDYRSQTGGSGSDDSVIDNFDGGQIGDYLKDSLGGYRKIASQSQINELLYKNNNNDGVEFIMSIEEDKVSGYACSDEVNGNFAFIRKGDAFDWYCKDKSVQDSKGLVVAGRFDRASYDNFNITYAYKDGAVVSVAKNAGDNDKFSWCEGTKRFESGTNCNGDYFIEGLSKDGLANSTGVSKVKLTKKGGGSMEVVVAGGKSEASGDNAGASPTRGGTGDGSDTGDKCYDGGNTLLGILPKNPLKWIICGVAQVLADAIDGFNGLLSSLLEFDPTQGDGATQLKQVWGNFLNIANILFVIAFLVMIISTALDLGIFSNYTVKKLLPRILIAVVLANLSWAITSSMIDLTNTVGRATQQIILQPVLTTKDERGQDIGDVVSAQVSQLASEGSPANVRISSTGIVLGLGTLIYFSIASAGAILLPAIAVAAIAVLIALAVVLARRIVLILLVIVAPLAFALWALPGGEKTFQRWWKVFMEMLIMYPFVMALISLGLFVSILLPKAGNGDSGGLGFATSAVALIAIVAPYFLIPTIFKLAGGVLGTLTGMVNDRSKGLVDRSRKWRDENSQYGRRKQQKAQFKNYRGQERMLRNLGEEKVAGSKYLAGRRRAQALGRAWGIGEESEYARSNFLSNAQAKASKERLDASMYALQARGQGGIDFRPPDGSKKLFRVERPDGSHQDLGKDEALAEAILGAKVIDTENGDVLSDGSLASQRAAAIYSTGQGLAPVVNNVRSQMATLSATGNATKVKQASGASAVLQEAMQQNVSQMMPKLPSYFKSEKLAFGRIEAGAFSNFDPTEGERLVNWASDRANFTDENNVYDRAAHTQAFQRIGESIRRIVTEPSKYNATPELMKATVRALQAAPVPPGGLQPDDVTAIGRIDLNTGVIR